MKKIRTKTINPIKIIMIIIRMKIHPMIMMTTKMKIRKRRKSLVLRKKKKNALNVVSLLTNVNAIKRQNIL